MAIDKENETNRLLRDRIAKLQATLRAYDAMLNTGMADALRKRNAELERALLDVVYSGHLPEAELAALKVTIGNKVTSKY